MTYLKDKIREAIDEFEKARRNEFAAKEETLRLQIEVSRQFNLTIQFSFDFGLI